MRVSVLITILLIFFIVIASIYYFFWSEIDNKTDTQDYDNTPPEPPKE
jgi:uncharacterized protein YpmB